MVIVEKHSRPMSFLPGNGHEDERDSTALLNVESRKELS